MLPKNINNFFHQKNGIFSSNQLFLLVYFFANAFANVDNVSHREQQAK